MWEPENVKQFETTVGEGALGERHDFDAKRQLPKSNKELAKDIAAMTTDGGQLVYGVGEDENGQPRLLKPFKLDGAAERIDQVAQNSVSGNPRLYFHSLEREDEPGMGYLIVTIPASPLAPHQVKVDGDRRFYGRCDTGNCRLSEEEVARLYERRQRQDVDREKLLAECIDSSPIGPPEAGKEGFLQAFAQPAVRDDDLWDRAVASYGDEDQLLAELRAATGSIASRGWGANLGRVLNWRRRGADKWSLSQALQGKNPDKLDRDCWIDADLSMDGRCYLFYGGAGQIRSPGYGEPVFYLYERGIALNLAQFLAMVGVLYRAGDQWGPIDVGMAVTGIRGAVSAEFSGHRLGSQSYGDEQALRTKRVDVRELQEDPVRITLELLDRLLRAASGGTVWDPFSD
jgi:hypothetical protein